MNEAATVALCESNNEHWPKLQVTSSPAAFSLLQAAAADHWAYNSNVASCVAVTTSSRTVSEASHQGGTWHACPHLPRFALPGAATVSAAKERQERRRTFMTAGEGA
jgi:hypothetical protein